VLAALASSPATKALDPDPFPRHSLRHAVYAALLHFGFEMAILITSSRFVACLRATLLDVLFDTVTLQLQLDIARESR